ncbi:hypothetical protein LPJ59_005144 [Coemansia sp. RSA 2399]|nr:hypothetical protein LPJ59_005144 [Coemansia sp. RSA 2399]
MTSSRAQNEDQRHRSASYSTGAGMQPSLSAVGKAHVRSAAAGLDAEFERPLPPPVSIPRSQSGTGRHGSVSARKHSSRTSASSDEDEDGLGIALTPRRTHRHPPTREHNRRPSADLARGKSQPTARANDLGFAPAHRISTPQPLPAHNSSSVASPYSHRSEFLSSNGQLDALLGFAGQPAAGGSRETPRSTPATPQHGTMPSIFQIQGSSTSGATGGSTAANSRRRSTTGQRRITVNAPVPNDPLRSNFPPLSFIIPRNRVDGRPTDLGMHRQDDQLSERKLRGAASGIEADNDDDDELMFQMETSSTTQR